MFRRRRPLNEWPAQELVEQVVTCFASDPDLVDVRASVVLYQDVSRLPKNAVKEAAREAAVSGVPFEGLRPYVVFHFGFAEDDREALYTDGDRTCLVRGVDLADTSEAARGHALNWVGPGGLEPSFLNIPGIYQSAFIEYITGEHQEADPTEHMWALPDKNGVHVYRDFPPTLKPAEGTPNPAFGLLPKPAVDALYEQRYLKRGW